MRRGERFLRREPAKYLAVSMSWTLRGIKFDLIENNWRMIVKIDDERGNHLVAFIVQSTIYDCWGYLYKHLTSTNAPLRWSTDRYMK